LKGGTALIYEAAMNSALVSALCVDSGRFVFSKVRRIANWWADGVFAVYNCRQLPAAAFRPAGRSPANQGARPQARYCLNRLPTAMPGKLKQIDHFPSRHASERTVSIWLPERYAESDGRYDVLYMHDGQNLFAPSRSWTGVSWGVEETAQALIDAGAIRPIIVVGIWHPEKRWAEYMPQKALGGTSADQARATNLLGGPPRSDTYLRFIVEELKPYIDSHYHTNPDAAHTAIMGSSMGGLISIYAVCEYPHIFGIAGCLSTHWVAGDGAVVDYLRTALPAAGQHRLWFDYGTEELDASYEPFQQAVDEMLLLQGYQHGVDWITRRFDGAGHSEQAWRDRLHLSLTFLLPNKGSRE
jgi:predicted alpha/beta superfamily hydrolase